MPNRNQGKDTDRNKKTMKVKIAFLLQHLREAGSRLEGGFSEEVMLELGSGRKVEACHIEHEGMCKGPVTGGTWVCLRSLRKSRSLKCRD